jgi:hypothetical protein
MSEIKITKCRPAKHSRRLGNRVAGLLLIRPGVGDAAGAIP